MGFFLDYCYYSKGICIVVLDLLHMDSVCKNNTELDLSYCSRHGLKYPCSDGSVMELLEYFVGLKSDF